MSLLMGNLLILLFMMGIVGFALAWAQCYDGAFREVFSFYRKRNLAHEWKVTGLLLLIVSVLVIGLYYGITLWYGNRFDSSVVPVSWYYMGFVLSGYLFEYLLICSVANAKNVWLILVVTVAITILPFVVLALILTKNFTLDTYSLAAFPVFLLLDLVLLAYMIPIWKKGDV